MARLQMNATSGGCRVGAARGVAGPHRPGRRGERGFTLVELLVVIVILGILSAVVAFAMRGSGDKGEQAASATDKRIIRTAMETFCARYGRYATNMDELAGGPYTDPANPGAGRGGPGFISGTPTYNPEIEVTAPALGGNPCGGYSLGAEEKCNGQPWLPETWCRTATDPTAAVGPTGGEKGTTTMVRLLDGRIFTGWDIFDPGAGTWTKAGPRACCGYPEFTDRSEYPVEMVVLKDNPATPNDNECKGPLLDNCGKVLVSWGLWYLFDPMAANTDGRTANTDGRIGAWTELQTDQQRYSGLTIDRASGARGVQITGTPNECGVNCGKVLIAGSSQGPPPPFTSPIYRAELFDPKTNLFSLTDSYTLPLPTFSPVVMAPMSRGQVLVITTDGRLDVPPNCNCFRALVFNSLTGRFLEVARPPEPNATFWTFPFRATIADLQFSDGPPVILSDGKIVFRRKAGYMANSPPARFKRTLVFDPEKLGPTMVGTDPWTEVEPCPAAPDGVCAQIAALPNGKVLNVGQEAEPPSGTKANWVLDPTKTQPNQAWERFPNDSPINPAAGGILISGGSCGSNCGKVLAISPRPQPSNTEYKAWLYKPAP
ncbi:MAG: prepilin-type N-terminal cleavage/methylation domain-containing protein [Acidimicrobiales bacterium]